ncbi:MAG: Rrf2 family transcriptional regulator [Bdellovibrionota bacterium]
MLKLNRSTEYGLMALSYIRSKTNGEVTSAREISEKFQLPFEILAKTLQRLKEQGVITSTYGTRGGYILARDLKGINFAEFLSIMEGPVSIVSCLQECDGKDSSCEYTTNCNIKSMMSALNTRFYDFLNRISVEELTRAALPRSIEFDSSTASAYDSVVFGASGEEP